MIRELHIRNLALISDLSVEFGHGFTVFTGETGAGKSILVGAIGLLLGDRGYTEQIRSGEEEADVTGTFELTRVSDPLARILAQNNIPLEDSSLIFRRKIQKSGKNRVYVNQIPVPLSVLKSIGDLLVDMHGQHDHQSLLNPDTAREIVDGLAGVQQPALKYAEAFNRYARARAELQTHDTRARDLAERRDIIEFQYRELRDLGLKPDEVTTLEQELSLLSSCAERAQCVQTICRILTEGGASVEKSVSTLVRNLQVLAKYDASVEPWISDVGNALNVLTELETFCSSYLSRSQGVADPARIDFINDRLAKVQRLRKKYRCSAEDLAALQQKLRQDLDALENVDADRSVLVKACEDALGAARRCGKALSGARQHESANFDAAITVQMEKLGFPGGKWKTELKPLQEPGPYGLEECRFLVCTNPGEPFLDLSRTASGGEISRLMLAVKTVLARQDSIPVLIFDEIDTGIGGITANEVAQSLFRLAQTHQVLCISHLHQIASLADRHLQVYKESVGTRTETKIREMDKRERVSEIARMLGGETAAALKHAEDLLRRR